MQITFHNLHSICQLQRESHFIGTNDPHVDPEPQVADTWPSPSTRA